MKTLDEVIKGLSICDDVECCYACPHSTDYNGCDVDWGYLTNDALHYLQEYKANQEDPDGDHQQLKKAQKLLWEFYQNDPLTWDELKQMEGKPVWVEVKGYNGCWTIVHWNSNIVFVEFYDWIASPDDFMKAPLVSLDDTNFGTAWQAYRKERE